MQFEKLAAAVAVATTDEVARISVMSTKVLGLQITNVGAAALDALEIWGKVKESATDFRLLFNGADYTTPVFPCLRASGSPVALAAAASAWVLLDVQAFSSIGIRASSTGSVTTLNIFGQLKDAVSSSV